LESIFKIHPINCRRPRKLRPARTSGCVPRTCVTRSIRICPKVPDINARGSIQAKEL